MFVSTQSARQYEAAFHQHYDKFDDADLGEPNRFGQDCYDATWILALALNNTLTGMMVQLFKVQYYMLVSMVHVHILLVYST